MDSEILKEVGDRIRVARKMSAWTAEGLAEEIGITKQALSLWESGQNRIQVDKLPHLAKTLGVSVGWLFGEGPVPAAPEWEPNARIADALRDIDRARAILREVVSVQKSEPEEQKPNLILEDAYGNSYEEQIKAAQKVKRAEPVRLVARDIGPTRKGNAEPARQVRGEE